MYGKMGPSSWTWNTLTMPPGWRWPTTQNGQVVRASPVTRNRRSLRIIWTWPHRHSAESPKRLLSNWPKQQKLTNSDNLVMAGGVAPTAWRTANWLRKEFSKISGYSLRRCSRRALERRLLLVHVEEWKTYSEPGCCWWNERRFYLGPEYNDAQIMGMVRKYGEKYTYYRTFNELTKVVAFKPERRECGGLVPGRMEYGPRALGGRSILGDTLQTRRCRKNEPFPIKLPWRDSDLVPLGTGRSVNEYFFLNCRELLPICWWWCPWDKH